MESTGRQYYKKEEMFKSISTHHLAPIKMANIKRQNKVLVRIWSNQNPCDLLVAMPDSSAAVENSKT